MSNLEFAIVLPEINGEFEAGIALGTEAAIDEQDLLNVIRVRDNPDYKAGESGPEVKSLLPLTTVETVKLTLAYLCDQLVAKNVDELARTMILAGTTILLKTGNITYTQEVIGGKRDNVPDGAWKFANSKLITKEMIAPERVKIIEDAIQAKNLQHAASVVVGTKINWFKENHHTGQLREGGAFCRKVIKAMYGIDPTVQFISYVHRLGHYASTRSVLSQLGIDGITPTIPVVTGTAKLKATDDIKLRMKSAPAGTARMAVSYALAKKMFAHPGAVFLGSTEKLADLPATYHKVVADPASYHFGARYLTGRRADYDDQEFEACLGRTGTFGKVFYPNSTLMKSPHAKNYENASDYDQEFESQLKAFKADRMKQHKAKMDAFKKVSGGATYNYAGMCTAFDVKPNADAVQVLAQIQKDEEERKKKAAENADADGGNDGDNDQDPEM